MTIGSCHLLYLGSLERLWSWWRHLGAN